nr:hypothetical protein [Tanacetum cinerariifolium]
MALDTTCDGLGEGQIIQGHLKRDYPKKKSGGFVRKGKHDQDLDSFDDEGGSYHMTHRRDFLYDFKVVDGGLVQLGLKRSLISLGTLEKEGYIVKMQMGRIKVIKGCWVMMTGIRKKELCVYFGRKSDDFGVQKHGGVHGVQYEKRVWFEVELQGAQGDHKDEVFQVSNDDVPVAQRRLEDKQTEENTNTNCLLREQEKVHLGIKVGANITVIGIPGQEGAEGDVAENMKVKESVFRASFQGLLDLFFNKRYQEPPSI